MVLAEFTIQDVFAGYFNEDKNSIMTSYSENTGARWTNICRVKKTKCNNPIFYEFAL